MNRDDGEIDSDRDCKISFERSQLLVQAYLRDTDIRQLPSGEHNQTAEGHVASVIDSTMGIGKAVGQFCKLN